MTGKETGWAVVGAGICLMLIFLSSWIDGKSPGETPIADMAKESIEYQLAIVNGGGYVPRDDITVARFCSLLDQLSSTYVEDKQDIADVSVTALKILENKGISESLLNIMEGMNQLFYTEIPNRKYEEYARAYVGFRMKGQSHKGAIKILQAIIKDIE